MTRAPRKSATAVTMAAVAQRAGVSSMTVSNYINGRNLKPRVRDAVAQAISELDYTPNVAARALASASAPCIGMLHNNATSPYASAAVFGALETASRLGALFLLQKIEGDSIAAAFDAMRALISRGANALLILPPVCEELSRHPDLAQFTLPMVGLSPGDALTSLSSVRIDDFAAARDMTTLLISKGHSRIGFIGAPPRHIVHVTRRAGYLNALQTFDIQIDPTLVVTGDMRFESGLEASEQLLSLAHPPTAIFACSDDMAAAVISVAHRRNLRIPQDLAVAGFDDSPLATKVWPPLTSVRQPIAAIASTAVEKLIATVRDPDTSGQLVTTTYEPYQIIRRQSTED